MKRRIRGGQMLIEFCFSIFVFGILMNGLMMFVKWNQCRFDALQLVYLGTELQTQHGLDSIDWKEKIMEEWRNFKILYGSNFSFKTGEFNVTPSSPFYSLYTTIIDGTVDSHFGLNPLLISEQAVLEHE